MKDTQNMVPEDGTHVRLVAKWEQQVRLVDDDHLDRSSQFKVLGINMRKNGARRTNDDVGILGEEWPASSRNDSDVWLWVFEKVSIQ